VSIPLEHDAYIFQKEASLHLIGTSNRKQFPLRSAMFRYNLVRHSAIGYDRNFRLVTLLPSPICNAVPERIDCDLVSTDPNRAIHATRSSTFRDTQATL